MNGRCISLIVCFLLVLSVPMIPAVLYAAEYSLDDLYRIALERAEKIKLTEEDLYIAKTGKEKALSLLLPRLSAFGNYTKYSEEKYNATGTLLQPNTATSWGLRADETLSLSGRELTALNISRENIVKSQYDLYAIREVYLLSVASAYYDVLRTKKSLEITESNLERLTKYRDAAEKRLKVGEVTKTVLLRAKGELSGARSDHVKAKNALELAKSVLARTVGIEGDFQIKESPSEDINISPETSFQELAYKGRADLKSLEVQKRMAEEQVQYTKGAFWPTLSVSGAYVSADQSPSTQTLVKESTYGLLSLNFPFFEGGLRRAEVKEARAKERQSALIYEDYKKSIGIEVQSAYLDLVTQKGILKFLEDQVVYARDNYNAVAKQFEFGLAQSLDVMDANTLLVTSERNLAEAGYNYQAAIIKMKKATGTFLKTITGDQS
ncbi:MAG: TolC family protein [Deltaproteobacteria bacterium]|nr:TolC family protein [Deltaproteobacteria bacterium]